MDEPEIASLSPQDPIIGQARDVASALSGAKRLLVLPAGLRGRSLQGWTGCLAGFRDRPGTGGTRSFSWLTPTAHGTVHIPREDPAAIAPSPRHAVRRSISVCESRRGRSPAARFAAFLNSFPCNACSERATDPRVTLRPGERAPSAGRLRSFSCPMARASGCSSDCSGVFPQSCT